MTDDLQLYHRAERRRKLMEPTTIYGRALTQNRSRQHLMEGFNRRILMLECSVEHIEETAEKADGKPLSTYAIPELAIHVNSLWLNVCGALDNLAWGMAYEFSLFPGVAEGPGQGREAVGLNRSKFLTRLEAVDAPFTQQIREYIPWQNELRSLRDPAAHRIPIYPIPGVLEGVEALEAQRLFAQADELMRAGNLHDGLGLINEGNALARFEPWIILSHDGQLEVRDLHKQMRTDEDQFAALSALVLNRIFRDTSGYQAI